MSSKLKTKLEHIWLDGYKPTQNLHSETKTGARLSDSDCQGWEWLERLAGRRLNSAAEPYKVAARVIKTIKAVPEYAMVNGR